MTVYTDLDRQWARIGATPAACACLTTWCQTEPALAAYPSPAAVVNAITTARRAPRARDLLGALLRVADDPFAARTALQAVLPGLRAERVLQPRYGHGVGERWTTADDTFADLVCAAWDTIRARAGQRHDDPERLVVRAATRRLRTVRQAHVRRQRRAVRLDSGRHDQQISLDEARTTAEQATLALIDAVRRGGLRVDQARLLYATSVAGWAAIDAARLAGLPQPRAVYYALACAHSALAATSA